MNSRSPALLAAAAIVMAALIAAGCPSVPAPTPTSPSPAPTGAPTADDPPTSYPESDAPGPVLPPAPGPEWNTLPPRPPTQPAPKTPIAEPTATPPVTVNLMAVSRAPSSAIAVAGGYEIRSLAGQLLGSGRALSGTLTLSRDAARIGTHMLPADGGTLQTDDAGDLSIGTLRYPGTLRVSRLADGNWRVSVLTDMETYLEGVVAGELPASFPRESMRAQAIVARTYVLSQRALLPGGATAKATAPLTVSDTGASDQEFAGIPRDPKVRAFIRDAVTSTRGLVLMSRGQPLRTWYHSTCGGETCPAKVVFRSPAAIAEAATAPGLGGAICGYCNASPKYRWSAMTLTGEAVVKAAGLSGALESFAVAETTQGGRASMFEVRAGGKRARVSAGEFRVAVGARALPSTWVDTAQLRGKDLVLSGRGWGHGVGLCQFGAKGMADRGSLGDAIVLRYYPGSELKRLW